MHTYISVFRCRGMNGKLTVNLAIRESEELVKKLDVIAKERGISRSDVVREYLRFGVKETEKGGVSQ